MIRRVCATFAAIVAISSVSAATVASPKPNVVFFVVDDVGWANVGWHNPENTATPNANALLKESVELDRHYVFFYCSPSRSSLLSGRLPMHVSEDNGNACLEQGAVPLNMTMLPAKLAKAGVYSVHAGKWHLGQAYNRSTPYGRGFNSSLGYLGGAEDHYTNQNGECGNCGEAVDLWQDVHPAHGRNNSGYSAYMWDDFAVQSIKTHARDVGSDKPLFLYYALQVAHAPNEPDRFADAFSSKTYTEDFINYNGMCSAWDSALGNVTAALKESGMWDNTLLVFTSDNGGPAAKFVSGSNANNYPLRGGKHTTWEGGHRAAAFVSGGLIPPAMRGTKLDGYVHIADWYGTVARLMGVDPTDDVPGLPPVDSIDMWPYITGQVSESPRTEVPLASKYSPGFCTSDSNGNKECSAALIVGDYKLVRNGNQYCFWQGEVYPNATTNHANDVHCPRACPSTGCLFNIKTDPGEHVDLAASMPDKAAQLLSRARALDATAIEATQPAGWRGNKNSQQYCDAMRKYGGFWGPYAP